MNDEDFQQSVANQLLKLNGSLGELTEEVRKLREDMNGKFASQSEDMNGKFASLSEDMNGKFASLTSRLVEDGVLKSRPEDSIPA